MSLVLGVDGGNSKAIALLAERDGTIVAAARRLGAADIYAAGEDVALEVISGAVDDALARVGGSRGDIGAAVFSLAGADWPEDFDLLRAALAGRRFGAPPLVVNDAIGALFGAIPDGPAVVVSIGTGAATGARGTDGRTWHSSFWQSAHGAGELSQRMLAAVVRAELGIGPTTMLRERLLELTGEDRVEAVLHRFTARRQARPAVIGPMVRALLEAGDAGDPVAVDVVVAHGRALGEVAAAAARRVGLERVAYDLAFTGGLAHVGAGRLLGTAIDVVRGAGHAPRIAAPRWEPAIGALVIGLRRPEMAVSWDEIAARLDATAPPPTLYDVLTA